MKPFTCCLFVLLACLGGCKGELTGVTVNLSADGSGDCQVIGIRDVQHFAGEKADPNGVMQGATETQVVELQVRQTSTKFASIADFKIGDVAFTHEKQDGNKLLIVRIPAAPDSKWFSALGVTESTLWLWNKLEDEAKKKDEARKKADPKAAGGGPHPSRDPPNVTFTINLPGKLAGQVFEAAPIGLTTKISVDRGERQAMLSVPLADIHAGKLKEVVWKISYAAE
jgi:hypothetical protein